MAGGGSSVPCSLPWPPSHHGDVAYPRLATALPVLDSVHSSLAPSTPSYKPCRARWSSWSSPWWTSLSSAGRKRRSGSWKHAWSSKRPKRSVWRWVQLRARRCKPSKAALVAVATHALKGCASQGHSSESSAKLPGQLTGWELPSRLPGLLSGPRRACLFYILYPCLLSAKGPEQLSFSSSYFPLPRAPPHSLSGRVINMQRMAPLL